MQSAIRAGVLLAVAGVMTFVQGTPGTAHAQQEIDAAIIPVIVRHAREVLDVRGLIRIDVDAVSISRDAARRHAPQATSIGRGTDVLSCTAAGACRGLGGHVGAVQLHDAAPGPNGTIVVEVEMVSFVANKVGTWGRSDRLTLQHANGDWRVSKVEIINET